MGRSGAGGVEARRVLGIDPSLRATGLGVVEVRAGRLAAVWHGVLRNPARLLMSQCLWRLQAGLAEAVAETRPDVAAVEGVFFAKNPATAVILGHARGCLVAACAEAGLAVYEYAPRRVKEALVGAGGASKEQVRRMVCRLLALAEEPEEDAADALAVAICHLHRVRRVGVVEVKRI